MITPFFTLTGFNGVKLLTLALGIMNGAVQECTN
jgi:hypothetical protein